MKRRIALIYGGTGVEHEVSVMGYRYVLSLLGDIGHDVVSVYIDKNGNWTIDGEQVFPYRLHGKGVLLTERRKKFEIDAAIPLLHGDGGESGEIQGLLKTANIPFVGADVSCGSVCLDKHYTKCIAKELGIPVAPWVCFPKGVDAESALELCERKLSFPIFIKPRRLGSSVGVYCVHDRSDFIELFTNASRVGNGLVIAENLIQNKRELECAFYSALGKTEISCPGEILNDGFYGYKEKYITASKTAGVADVSDDIRKKIRDYSLRISDACGLRHLGRIDYFLAEQGLILNEINTFPGFTEKSLYPKMLNALGISPKDAISSFIEDAIGC